MAYKVFVDGQEGTTGIEIADRLALRSDIELLKIDEALRKDVAARKELLNAADVAFLCLPDAAAIEAASMIENDKTIVIDPSTAHRVAKGWDYGLPELSKAHRQSIASSKRISNPGCYATGMISLVYPLVASGLLPKDYPLVVHAVSGYSGAGKKAIAQYNDENRDKSLESPREYGLTLSHKHLPEMMQVSGLSGKPIFNPYICDYYSGMTVSVPLHLRLLNKKASVQEVLELLSAHYEGANYIHVSKAPEDGFIPATKNLGTNHMDLYVSGNDEQILLVSSLDNLGKGASGAAVQNMNIALGIDETSFLP